MVERREEPRRYADVKADSERALDDLDAGIDALRELLRSWQRSAGLPEYVGPERRAPEERRAPKDLKPELESAEEL